jgi:hypothetical protein
MKSPAMAHRAFAQYVNVLTQQPPTPAKATDCEYFDNQAMSYAPERTMRLPQEP